MFDDLPKNTHPVDLMKIVRTSLENVRNSFGDEAAQTDEARGQIQQLVHLEQLLIDQEARLDAVNKVLEEFNYSVAHELFAPLRRISGFTKEIMQRSVDDLDLQGMDYLNAIMHSSQQMNELIESLMQVSRLLHIELQPSSLDLSDIAGATVLSLREEEPSRQAEFSIQTGLRAEGDPALIKTALQKLLENAWKFTSYNERTRIEVGNIEVESASVFYIKDNGAGFDSACVDRLFHPFQRLHDRRRFPGNGLGLTAVKRIIERHGGTVWAEGAVGQGATFYFTLPSRTK